MKRALRIAIAIIASSASSSCGDGSSASASASASVSAPAPPPCNGLALAEALPRCKEGEARCCDRVTEVVDKAAPDRLDTLAIACGGGTETACQSVRDAARDPAWKLEALDRACTRIGRWTCRAAVQLALVHDPERLSKTFENNCRQTNDPEIQLAARSFKCPSFASSGLADLAPEAARCREGDLAACKRIADVDAAGKKLLMEPIWRRRGVDPKEASEAWILSAVSPEVKPAGTVRYTLDPKDTAIASALEASSKDRVRACVGQRHEVDDKPRGEAKLELVVDNGSKVAFTDVAAPSELDPRLITCLRAALQDSDAKGASAGSKLMLTLDVK